MTAPATVLAATVGGGEVAMMAAIAALLAASVFLALAETALTRTSRTKAQALAEQGKRRAVVLERLVRHPDRWLNPLLLVVLGLQLVQATLVGVLAERFFGPAGVAVATAANVGVMFVVAEAAPKTWALQHPDRAALLAARPVAALAAFPPLRLLSRGLIGLTNVVLPGKGLKDGPFITEDELLALAEVAVEEAVIEEDERELIASIIEFGDTVVREVMVPRPDMVTVPAAFRVVDVMEVSLLNGLSRIPAMGPGGVDDVVGIVYAKDLMRAERDDQGERPVHELVREAHFVPETKRVSNLLREMQAQSFHMAVVVDEYGGTAGLVTLEDLIEELVGEIVDEYDREEPMVEPMPDGRVKVNARIPVDELNDVLDANLPEGDWDTVGGLLLYEAGHVPVEGEAVASEGWLLQAERIQGRRISRVVVQPASCPVPDHHPAAAGATVDHDGARS